MTKFDKAKKRVSRNRRMKRFHPYVYINDFEIFILALPLVPFVVAWEKFKDWNYQRMKWDKERAVKVLDYVLPRTLEWNEEDNAFFYYLGWSPSMISNNARIIDKKWCRKFEYELRSFIGKGYENPNYTKTIEEDYDNDWVKFVEK